MNLSFLLLLFVNCAAAFAPVHVDRKSSKHLPLSALPDFIELPSQFKNAAEVMMTASAAPDSELGVTAVVPPDTGSLEIFSSLGDAGPAIGIAALAVVAGFSAMSASGGSTEGTAPEKKAVKAIEPVFEPVDVSIPYDAASVLAYKAFKAIDEIDDMEEFTKFKKSYESYTVAEVAFKKATREFEAMKSSLTTAEA
ncbi:hypothetical protein ACA910_022208 [Epithemia clementina (nom. ined.)]